MSEAPTTAPSADTEDRSAPAASDGDWTRNLTTIAVVAPKPRPGGGPAADSADAGAADADSTDADAAGTAADAESSDADSAGDEVPLVLPRRRGDDAAPTEGAVPAAEKPFVPGPTPAPEPPVEDAADTRLKSLVAAWVAVSDTETPDGTSAQPTDEAPDETRDETPHDTSVASLAESESESESESETETEAEAVAAPAAVEAATASPTDIPEADVDGTADPESGEGADGAGDGPAAEDPDTALLSPVEPAGGPDTALLSPVGQSGAKGADLDSWVASLGARPKELADKPGAASADTPAEAKSEAGDAGNEAKETVPARRRFINPWLGGAAVVALLLAGAAAVENPFTMATAERVPVSDVPRMSDPEPDQDNGPVNGGLPVNLELPPVLPAAAPGASVAPSASPSGPATSGQPFTLPPVQSQTPASTVTGSNGIPQLVLSAYKQAAEYTAKADPKCRLPWELLAAVGRVESGHANGGQVSTTGTALTPILGPRLDGTRSTKAIRDTDKGTLDFDTEFDRAVGPMQFIPTSWKAYAMDGNKDGKKDPQNVYDATLTAARYLCAGDRDLSTEAGLDKAIFSYNQSPEYVRSVKAWTVFYRQGVRPVVVPPAPPATSSKPPTQQAPTSPSSSKSTSKAPATTTKSAPKTSRAPSS
ncbi:lytic transglycosylase domain-containing protein [Streptodolium elevatio]